jgi:5-keto-L-gluconate epimerase
MQQETGTMKLGFVVATPEVRGTDATAYQGPLEPFFAQLQGLKYDGVELMIRDPKDIDAPALRSLLRHYQLEVAIVNTGRVFIDDGLHLMTPPGPRREAALERMYAVIDFAVAVANPAPRPFGVQVNTGLSRGQPLGGQDRHEARVWAVENLRRVASYARGHGVIVALEPINRYQSTFINSGQEGIELIREVGADNLRLQMDVFHMNIEESSLCGSLIRYRDYVSHVHVCDTNRQAPGLGHLDFVEIVDTLAALGYEGYLSAELATLDQRRAAEITSAVLRPLLARS